MLQFKHLKHIPFIEHGITEAHDSPPQNFMRGEQIHSNHVVWIEHLTSNEIPQADALLTKEKNIPIAVVTADCIPLILADLNSGVVGVIHAGWRGTVARIVEKTLQLLNVNLNNLKIGLGPAICPRHFIVGEEVAQQFDPQFIQKSEIEPQKYYVDLWEANKHQILQCGVPKQNIEVMRVCTFESPTLFSYRRDKTKQRNYGFIKILNG